MEKIYLVLVAILISTMSFGQGVSPEVIASGGDHFSGSNIELSWTIGEPLTETYISGPLQITQGFHQTNLVVTSLNSFDSSLELHVFPNPTQRLLQLIFSNNDKPLVVSVYDVPGRLLKTQKIDTGQPSASIDLFAWSSGTYYLLVTDGDGQRLKTFKIQKTK